MTKHPQSKREQREASVERLLMEAQRLFVSQGFRHTTAEQIAEAAGLTKGSLYFYFGSKANVLLRLLDRAEAVVVDAMEARVARAGPSARDRLVAFIHGQAQLGVELAETVMLLILMSLEFRGSGGVTETRLRAIYGRLYGAVERIIEEGKVAGEFRADVATREQASIVLAGHDGTLMEWYRRRDDLDGRELVRALRGTMLDGMSRIESRPGMSLGTEQRPAPGADH